MKHLKFPFVENVTVEISNGSKKTRISCELASSDVEIFQSLNYRKSKDFDKPLVLLFANANKQYFSLQSFNFPVTQISIDPTTNSVKKKSYIPSTKNKSGYFIQSYCEFSMVILFPDNFDLLQNIVEDKTKIKIK